MTPKSELRFRRKRVDGVREKKGEDVLQGKVAVAFRSGMMERAQGTHTKQQPTVFKRSREKNPLHQADHKSYFASLW
jgi:hypothetical protein